MQTELLTTTLSELNRLYAEYFETTEGSKPDVQKAVRAWIAYEIYARRYNRERGLDSVPGVAESNEKAVDVRHNGQTVRNEDKKATPA